MKPRQDRIISPPYKILERSDFEEIQKGGDSIPDSFDIVRKCMYIHTINKL